MILKPEKKKKKKKEKKDLVSICSGLVVLRLGNRGMEIAHPRICTFCFLFLQADGKVQLDILVENMGRVNFLSDINRQRKGGNIYLSYGFWH